MTDSIGRSVKMIDGREIVFRELTVGDVRAMANDKSEFEVITDGLFPALSLRDLPRLTSLTLEEIDQMLPSQIAKVIDYCKECNPHFFDLLARLSKSEKA